MSPYFCPSLKDFRNNSDTYDNLYDPEHVENYKCTWSLIKPKPTTECHKWSNIITIITQYDHVRRRWPNIFIWPNMHIWTWINQHVLNPIDRYKSWLLKSATMILLPSFNGKLLFLHPIGSKQLIHKALNYPLEVWTPFYDISRPKMSLTGNQGFSDFSNNTSYVYAKKRHVYSQNLFHTCDVDNPAFHDLRLNIQQKRMNV